MTHTPDRPAYPAAVINYPRPKPRPLVSDEWDG